MQTVYIGENAIHFFKKGIAFSLLIFAGLTAHAGPSNMEAPYSKGKISSSATDCTYTLSAMNHSVGANAGANVAVTVTAIGTSCTWTAAVASNVGWITVISGASGTGNGTVTYSYKANMSAAERTGTLTIAGQTYTVTQAGRPLVSDGYEPNNTPETAYLLAANFSPSLQQNAAAFINISPATSHINNDVDYYKINLSTDYTYTLYVALYDSNYQNDGSNYTLDVKMSYSTDNGIHWINLGDSQLHPTKVSGGTFYLKIDPHLSNGGTGTYAAKIGIRASCNGTLSALSRLATREAGLGGLTVTTGPSCAWTAVSNGGWITITSGASAMGSGTVSYSYTENTSLSSRIGTMTIAGETYTVTQAPRPDRYEENNANNTVEQASLLPSTFTNNASAIDISSVNCHAASDVDYYKISLEPEYTYTLSGALYGSYNQNKGSNYTLDAKISYSTNGTRWSATADKQLLPATVPGGTLYLKIEPARYNGVGAYAAKIEIKRSGTAGCTYTLSPNKQAAKEADSDQVTVTTSAPSCIWSATSDISWITIASGSGTGSRNVDYSYQANMATAPRIGRITIADKTYTVAQEGRPLIADAYEGNEGNNIKDKAYQFPALTFTQNVATVDISPASCHLTSDVDYYKIVLETGYTYRLSGALYGFYNQIDNSNYTLVDVRISYSTDGGANWSGPPDSQLPHGTTVSGGDIYLKIWGAGSTGPYAAKIEIKRATTVGCTYSLSAVSKEATTQAGSEQVTVTATGSSCIWTATSNVGWITVTSGASASGSGNVGYSYTENTSPSSRRGTISVAGETYTVTQAGRPIPPDSYEPNDSKEAAHLLEANFSPSLQQNATAAILISSANCHATNDVDYYKIELRTEYTYRLSGILYVLGNQIDHSNYTLGAEISYSIDNGASWSKPTDRRLSPATVPGGTLYLKIKPSSNGYAGAYAARIDIRAGCSASLPVLKKTVTSAEGSEQITAIPGSSCASSSSWTAVSNADWLTFAGGARTVAGTGNIGYSYAANTTADLRTGTITVAAQTYTVTQAPPPDRYEPNNTAAQPSLLTPTFNQNASVIHISPANCHAADDVDIYKINLEAGYTYAIGGEFYDLFNPQNNNRYTLHAKITYSTDEGTAWNAAYSGPLPNLSVQGGHPFYLKIESFSPEKQKMGTYAAQININRTVACTYTLSERSKRVTSDAGSVTVTVTASSSCNASHSWAAASNAWWLTTEPSESKTGSGHAVCSYPANTTLSSRTGTITIAGHAYTLIQEGLTLSADGYEPNNEFAQASLLTPEFIQNVGVANILQANCHLENDVDYYKIELETGYTYRLRGTLYDSDNQINNSRYTLDAEISYSTDNGANWSRREDIRLSPATVPGGTLYLKIKPWYGE